MDLQVSVVDECLALVVLTFDTEEEKKALIAMLGKLQISANSRTEKLQSTTELVVEAIDDQVAQDAPSRNALNKLHSALVKALGHPEVKQISGDMSAPAGKDNGLTTIQEEGLIKAQNEYIRTVGVEDEGVSKVQNSMLEGLLDGEDDG